MDAEEDPQNQAGQANPRQPAAAVRVGVLADEPATRESDVIDGGCKPDVTTAGIDESALARNAKPATASRIARPRKNSASPSEEGSAFSNRDRADASLPPRRPPTADASWRPADQRLTIARTGEEPIRVCGPRLPGVQPGHCRV